MGIASKPDFPPLLPPGQHSKSMAEIESLCVSAAAFTTSPTRQAIFDGLRVVVDELASVGVNGKLWVNGSFLTQKLDPEDVDVILHVRAQTFAAATPEQVAKLDWLSDNLKDTHLCDSYVRVAVPKGHPAEWMNEYYWAYWLRQFGFTRDDKPKGIAVLEM